MHPLEPQNDTAKQEDSESPAGFTLVEIMSTVAITGILVAITVPQYQRMQARSLQREAITGLTSIYIAERNFAAESGTYTTCIEAIGINAVQGARVTRFYTLGFSGNGIPWACGPGNNLGCNNFVWDNGLPLGNPYTCTNANAAYSNDGGGNYGDYIPANSSNSTDTAVSGVVNLDTQIGDMTRATFTARAAGSISSVSGYDKWSIDQRGTPTNWQPIY